MKKLLAICAALALTGCASMNSNVVRLSLEQANAITFNNNAPIRTNQANINPGQAFESALLNQPGNKTVRCRLYATKDQKEAQNFVQVWDGSCRNGYAHGLGRDIVISDLHHLEEISQIDFSDESARRVFIFRDFIQRITFRGAGENRDPSTHKQGQRYGTVEKLIDLNDGGAISEFSTLWSDLDTGTNYMRVTDPTNRGVTELAIENGAAYVHRHSNTSVLDEVTDEWYSFPGLIPQNPDASLQVPVRVRRANGQVQDFILINGSFMPLVIESAQTYWSQMTPALSNLNEKLRIAETATNEAAALEKTYAHKLKRSGSVPKGITKADYYAINDYYAGFAEKQAATVAGIVRNTQEQMQRKIENAQRNAEIAAQKEAANAQHRAAAAAETANFLSTLPKTTNCFKFGNQVNCTTN